MNTKITKLTSDYDQHQITRLLQGEEKILKRFKDAIASEEASIYVAEGDEELVGILILQRQNRLSVVPTIFVHKAKRNQGIGTELLRFADQVLEVSKYEYAECEFDANPEIASMLDKKGYVRNYTVIRLERDNTLISPDVINHQTLKDKGILIRNYRDEDYWAYHNIVDVGFYLMRKKACTIQWYNEPSEYDRKMLADNYSCRYVMIDHAEIVAICKIYDNDIALLGVRPDKQKQGYGTLLISYFINKIIIEQQASKVTIGVLEGNPAEKLYLKMKFREVGRRYDYIKFYQPESRPKAPLGYANEEEIMEAFSNHGMIKEDM